MKTTPRVIVAAAALAVGLACLGCGSTAGGSASTERTVNNKAKPGEANAGETVMGETTARTAGQEIHDPGQAQPGGSYRITPANPDDPKYKPGPGIGGGN